MENNKDREKSIIDSENFFSEIRKHLENSDSPDVNRFHVGTKLTLDIEVRDSFVAGYLLKWLYGNGSARFLPFGCELTKIGFGDSENNDHKLKRIMEIINE